MARFLFVHQNFPAQFRALAPALVEAGHHVVALSTRADMPPLWRGVRVVIHRHQTDGVAAQTHRWARDFHTKVIRGEAVYRIACLLKAQGFEPDAIVAHPGWGEGLFLADVWPKARIGLYCEYFYSHSGNDVGFDPEFAAKDPGEACRVRMKNVGNLVQLDAAACGIAPTRWQAQTFPAPFRDTITICHDGIDTAAVAPRATARLALPGGRVLTREDAVVTFVNRNLEPYRGYHVLMRALPAILAANPQAHIAIIGGDGVSYGPPPPAGSTWKSIFLAEVAGAIDAGRVHFLGRVDYERYLDVLNVSRAHVYLSYPFVLSWSMLEAMSLGCTVIASDTAPVREVIEDGRTGHLVDFFDRAGLADRVSAVLAAGGAERAAIGTRARATIIERYDLETRCRPGQMAWAQALPA